MWSTIIFIVAIIALAAEFIIGLIIGGAPVLWSVMQVTFFVAVVLFTFAMIIEKIKQKELDEEEIAQIKAERKNRLLRKSTEETENPLQDNSEK